MSRLRESPSCSSISSTDWPSGWPSSSAARPWSPKDSIPPVKSTRPVKVHRVSANAVSRLTWKSWNGPSSAATCANTWAASSGVPNGRRIPHPGVPVGLGAGAVDPPPRVQEVVDLHHRLQVAPDPLERVRVEPHHHLHQPRPVFFDGDVQIDLQPTPRDQQGHQAEEHQAKPAA